MPVNFQDDCAVVDGIAVVDEAEALLDWLQRHPQGEVAMAACTHLHAACLQALMAGRARVRNFPADAALAVTLRRVLNPTNKEIGTP